MTASGYRMKDASAIAQTALWPRVAPAVRSDVPHRAHTGRIPAGMLGKACSKPQQEQQVMALGDIVILTICRCGDVAICRFGDLVTWRRGIPTLSLPQIAKSTCYNPRPMAQIREIKKRMVAVGTIQRITKTMQMIATAKFTAAVARAKATKPYTNKIRQLVGEVAAAAGDVEHPLLKSLTWAKPGSVESARRELLLVITSDRGLCGAYNGNVLRKALGHIRDLKSRNIAFNLETSGKKAVGFFRFLQMPITHRHTIGDKPKYEDVERLASRFIDEFSAGKFDAVRVAYMRFESNSRQVPELMQLLPLSAALAVGAAAGGAAGPAAASQPAVAGERAAAAALAVGPKGNYEFSPSSDIILAALLPMAVKASLFQAFNDAVVSEQIMRMVAMKAATENAKDLGKTLKRQFNRARQSKITTELTEIVSGAAALT
jgi:F-type H+-transporting ATPase subunit gamma